MFRKYTSAEVFNAELILGVLLYVVIEVLLGQRFHLQPGSISEQVRSILWFSALCGIASAGTIEILKRVMRLRGLFQMRYVRDWLAERSRSVAFKELLDVLRLGKSDTVRIFNLPTERLAAQIAAGTDVALAAALEASESPHKPYEALLEALAGRDLPKLAAAPDPWNPKQSETFPEQRELLEYDQAVRTGIDQLQIAVGERWRSTVQGAALWIAGTFGVGLTYASGRADTGGPRYVLAALLLGGPFAWIVRDAAALLERARR